MRSLERAILEYATRTQLTKNKGLRYQQNQKYTEQLAKPVKLLGLEKYASQIAAPRLRRAELAEHSVNESSSATVQHGGAAIRKNKFDYDGDWLELAY